MAKSKHSEDDRKEIIKELAACNRSEYIRLGTKYGVSYETIRSWAVKYGAHKPDPTKSTKSVEIEVPLDPDSLAKMTLSMEKLKPKYTELMKIKNDILELQKKHDILEDEYIAEQREYKKTYHISM